MNQKNLDFLRKADKIYIVAMKEELDSELLKTPVIYTGVGKARVTRAVVKYIFDNYELFAAGKGPVIVSLGTAGSAKYKKGDILLVDNFYNNGDKFIRHRITCDTFPEPTGLVCGSSDFFVCKENFSDKQIEWMHNEFDCMDMESYAIANICEELGVKFCGIKCVSDGADSPVIDFDKELPRFREILNNFAKTLE